MRVPRPPSRMHTVPQQGTQKFSKNLQIIGLDKNMVEENGDSILRLEAHGCASLCLTPLQTNMHSAPPKGDSSKSNGFESLIIGRAAIDCHRNPWPTFESDNRLDQTPLEEEACPREGV